MKVQHVGYTACLAEEAGAEVSRDENKPLHAGIVSQRYEKEKDAIMTGTADNDNDKGKAIDVNM